MKKLLIASAFVLASSTSMAIANPSGDVWTPGWCVKIGLFDSAADPEGKRGPYTINENNANFPGWNDGNTPFAEADGGIGWACLIDKTPNAE